MKQIRLISFAGNTFTIEASGPNAVRVADLLYHHIPAGQPGASRLTYRLLDGDSPDGLRLYRDQTLLYRGNCQGVAAELLLGDTCSQFAAQCRTGLILHAAALCWRGHGLLLPGASGAGKSTLSTWLAAHEFTYMTDELVFVPWQTDSIRAFTRPINLKCSARSVLSELFDFENQAANTLSSPYADLVPPALLHPTPIRNEAPLSLMIFPRYQANGSFELRQLSRAQAGLALMQTLINARNLPKHGFSEITRLSRRTSAYVMCYNSFDQISGHVQNLLDSLSSSLS